MSYKYINFELIKDSHCCGIFKLGCFSEESDSRNWSTGVTVKAKTFETPAPVLEKFDADLHDSLQEYIRDDAGYTGSYLIRCSLVEKYDSASRGQLSHLQEHLLKKGWKKEHTFMNANSGNSVAVFSTILTEDEVNEFRGCEVEDESW